MRLSLALAAAAALCASTALAAPVAYKVNRDHVDVTFTIDHLGFSNTHGRFRDVDGTLTLDAGDPQAAKVDITVKSASIDTNHAGRDKDLQGANFFDAAKFPDLRFVSTKVTRTGQNTADVQGDLTLRGVTRPPVLKARLNKMGPNPFNQAPTAGFTATGVLKRSDFGMTQMIPMIGDEVTIVIDAEFGAAK